jgi:hypothetical protein
LPFIGLTAIPVGWLNWPLALPEDPKLLEKTGGHWLGSFQWSIRSLLSSTQTFPRGSTSTPTG